MASILDSFKETYSDNFSFFKIVAFAIPIYFLYEQYLKGPVAFAGVLFYVYLVAFLLFGFFIKSISSVVNEKDSIMPSLNPFKLALTAIKGVLAILPVTLICVSIANYAISFINFIPWLDNTLKTIIWLVVASILLTTLLMYVKSEKILDAFNFKILSEKAGDFILAIVFFILQLFVINLPTVGFIGYAIYILFGFGPVLYFFIAYAVVFNLVASAHYMAQLQYEIMGVDKQNYTPIK